MRVGLFLPITTPSNAGSTQGGLGGALGQTPMGLTDTKRESLLAVWFPELSFYPYHIPLASWYFLLSLTLLLGLTMQRTCTSSHPRGAVDLSQ